MRIGGAQLESCLIAPQRPRLLVMKIIVREVEKLIGSPPGSLGYRRRSQSFRRKHAYSSLASRCLATGAYPPSQVRREFLLRVEHAPLHRADRNGLGCRDFVIFPFLNESQGQRFLLPRVQE